MTKWLTVGRRHTSTQQDVDQGTANVKMHWEPGMNCELSAYWIDLFVALICHDGAIQQHRENIDGEFTVGRNPTKIQ